MRWAGYATCMETRNAHKILVTKLKGKKPLGRHRYSIWIDNIKMDLKEIGCEGVEWIYLSHYRAQWWDPTKGKEFFE
jgi:hypothetical protein